MKEEFVELIEIRLHRTIIFKETLSFKFFKKKQAWLVHPRESLRLSRGSVRSKLSS